MSQRPNPPLPARPFGLLLVEGGDERAVCEAVAGPAVWAGLHCWNAGGRNRLPQTAQIAALDPNFSHVRAVGVVLDVEDDLAGAQAIAASVLALFGTTFQAHGVLSGSPRPAGVFFSPDGASHGCIESLCRRAVRGAFEPCVDQYVLCAGSPHAHVPNARAAMDKAWLKAYLAMLPDPSLRFHQAFSCPDGIDPGHAAFSDLRAFLCAL